MEVDIDRLLKSLVILENKTREADDVLTAIKSEIWELFWDVIEQKRKIKKSIKK